MNVGVATRDNLTMSKVAVLLRAPKEDDSYQKVDGSCLVVRTKFT